MKINTGTASPPNNGTSISPGSRRAAAMSASSSFSPRGTKVASNNSTFKVTNSSQQNGSAKVPSITIGKVTNSTTNSNATGDISKAAATGGSNTVRIPINQTRPNLKTTERKSMAPQAGPPRNNPNVVSHVVVTSVKTSHKKVSRDAEVRADGDDTDTEIEESPTKQSPIPSRSLQRLVPEAQLSRELIKEIKPRQLVSPSSSTPTVANVPTVPKRPFTDPPKKLSEIRPKVSRLSNSNVASTPPMSSQVRTDHNSNSQVTNNRGISNMNNNREVPPQASTGTAISQPLKPLSSNYNDWSIDDVVNYLIKVDETFDDPKIREKFHEHVSFPNLLYL